MLAAIALLAGSCHQECSPACPSLETIAFFTVVDDSDQPVPSPSFADVALDGGRRQLPFQHVTLCPPADAGMIFRDAGTEPCDAWAVDLGPVITGANVAIDAAGFQEGAVLMGGGLLSDACCGDRSALDGDRVLVVLHH
jgi:hypothetical protein